MFLNNLFKRKRKSDWIEKKENFFEWYDEQPGYGMWLPPLKAQKGMDFLYEYFDMPPFSCPLSTEQENTYILFSVLIKTNRRFRKEYRKRLKSKRGFLN